MLFIKEDVDNVEDVEAPRVRRQVLVMTLRRSGQHQVPATDACDSNRKPVYRRYVDQLECQRLIRDNSFTYCVYYVSSIGIFLSV